MIHKLPNGLVLLTEEMKWCESVSYSFLIPCGSNDDPAKRQGLSNFTCEMITRGAGELGNRQLSEAFENLGSERSESVSQTHTAYSAQTLASHLLPTLALTAKMVRVPHLAAEQIDAARQVILQEIVAIEDEPSQKMMIELARNFFPDPWGRPSCGEISGVHRITAKEVRDFHKRWYQPNGVILSVAGKFDTNALLRETEKLFGDWQPQEHVEPQEISRSREYQHIPYDSSQTHLGIAFASVPLDHPDYLAAWSGVNAISGGVSGRLFNEIREKRGLCYAVSASYLTLANRGCVFCYCGSTAAKAQESLDVLLEELRKLNHGIDDEELRRVVIRAKYSLVVQQESTSSRSSAMARDWYHLGRIRSKEEMERDLNLRTVEKVNEFWKTQPIGPFHIVSLGPEPLVSPCREP